MPTTDQDEYKGLRDEMVSLFHRMFVTLGAVVGASALLSVRIVEPRPAEAAGASYVPLYLAFLNGALLAVALMLTTKFYDHIYRIGSYIRIFLDQGARWHARNTRVLDRVPKELWPRGRGIARFTEPEVVGLVYFVLSVNAVVLVAHVSQRWSTRLAWAGTVLLGGVLIFLLSQLGREVGTRIAQWEAVWREICCQEKSAAPNKGMKVSGEPPSIK